MSRLKIILITGITNLLVFTLEAQNVGSISVEQEGNKLIISYNLEAENPCDISLYVSLDNGRTWSQGLGSCTGSIGGNISSGKHVIVWDVLEDRKELWGDDIRFRVKARMPQPKNIEASSQQRTRTNTNQSPKKLNGREIALGIVNLVAFIWLMKRLDLG